MQGKGFYPTHSVLWTCCKELLNHGNSLDRGGFHFHLSSMLFAYLSYEAYLNFVGHFVATEEWRAESRFFREGKYKGTKGKFEFLREKFELEIDKNKPPYSTVTGLGKLRDFLSHGKTEYYTITKAALRKDQDFPFSGKLESWVTPEKNLEVKKAVFDLCSVVHLKVKAVVHDRRLGDNPFSACEEIEITG